MNNFSEENRLKLFGILKKNPEIWGQIFNLDKSIS